MRVVVLGRNGAGSRYHYITLYNVVVVNSYNIITNIVVFDVKC